MDHHASFSHILAVALVQTTIVVGCHTILEGFSSRLVVCQTSYQDRDSEYDMVSRIREQTLKKIQAYYYRVMEQNDLQTFCIMVCKLI